MGADKAALKFDGQTQLVRTVSLLRDHIDEVVVSSRPDQVADPLRAGFPQLPDAYDELGPLAGILTALESSAQPWLVVACDLPNVDATTIRHLLDKIDTTSVATAYRSTVDGLPEPLCAVWMPAAIGPIHAAVQAGRYCPRKILINEQATLLEQPVAGALDNINTPEDLVRVSGAIS